MTYYTENEKRMKFKFQCPCGGHFQYNNRNIHFKLSRHKKYEENLETYNKQIQEFKQMIPVKSLPNLNSQQHFRNPKDFN